MTLARVWRPLPPRLVPSLAFGGAALLVAMVALPSFEARADTPAFNYSSVLTAIGLRTQLDSNPEPTSVPDLTDVEVAESDAQLDSFGTAEASGHVGNLNGVGNLPDLICEATGGTPFDCGTLPVGTATGGLITSFPPPDPLDAAASYPTPKDAYAPALGSTAAQASITSGPLTGSAGAAQAHVTTTSTSTKATMADVGVDGFMHIGSITTTSSQSVTDNGLVSHAESALSGISIGTGVGGSGLVTIAGVDTVSDTVSKPGGGLGTDTTSTTIVGVDVLGQTATIDSTGIHVTGNPSLPSAVTSAYQDLLNSTLSAAGITITSAGITRSDGNTGHTVDAGGLIITLDQNVSGVPTVVGGLPPGVPCPIETVTSQLPVDPCAGVAISPDGEYFGSLDLGQTGIVSDVEAGDDGLDTFVPAPETGDTGSTTDTGITGSPTSAAPSQSSTGPATTSPVGSSATGPSSTGGAPADGGGAIPGSSVAGSAAPAPAIAGTSPQAASAEPRNSLSQVAQLDPLAGVHGRLLWFFPALLLAGLGILATRGRKPPPRIPGLRG